MRDWLADRRARRWRDQEYRERVTQLARYNSERAHGLVHTDRWQAIMAREQAWFDALPRPGQVPKTRVLWPMSLVLGVILELALLGTILLAFFLSLWR